MQTIRRQNYTLSVKLPDPPAGVTGQAVFFSGLCGEKHNWDFILNFGEYLKD
jgi:hypothetical protein